VGFRKYQSRVGAFNRFLRANGSTEEERELIAAKLVGRWRSGAPLTLAPDVDNPALGADAQRNNDFDYSKDAHGRQGTTRLSYPAHEPAGHATHPPDRCEHPSPYTARHDLWTTIRPERAVQEDDEVPRGAIFLFMSAKAMATIEFLQQEWINDGNFIGAGNERDPIIGRQEEGGDLHDSEGAC
jgi:deferrochelatase/peroxidase EfeB